MDAIFDAQTGESLVPRVVRADRLGWRAARGLLGRSCLPVGEGMLLADPLCCVHTLGMRFPIDVVFLDRELVVIAVARRLEPWRIARRAGGVRQLELAADEAERIGLRRGRALALAATGGPSRVGSPHGRRQSGKPAHERVAGPCGRPSGLPSVPPGPSPGPPPSRGHDAPLPAPTNGRSV